MPIVDNDCEVTLYYSRRGLRARHVFTEQQHDQARRLLALIEWKIYRETGVNKISGGYCKAEMLSYTTRSMLIKVTWGVSSDCERRRNREWYRAPNELLKRCIKGIMLPDEMAGIICGIKFLREKKEVWNVEDK